MRLGILALGLFAGPALAQGVVSLPADGLNWATTPEGVAFAPLDGDRFTEPYMAMVALPGGLVGPAHTKTADMFGVVVSGEMTHVGVNDDPLAGERLGAGAYCHVPAGLAHVSSCVSAEECVTFLYQPGPFDFNPVRR